MIYVLFIIGSLYFPCATRSEYSSQPFKSTIVCRSCGNNITSTEALTSQPSSESRHSFEEAVFNDDTALIQLLSKDNFEFHVITTLRATCESFGEMNIFLSDMPRTYISKSLRPHRRYDPLIIKTAVEVYHRESKSLAEIAKEYNIQKSVLHRHVTRNMKNQGGQRCLREEVERYIITYINTYSEWGYPIDEFDLRLIIKGYLDRIGLQIKKFNNNLPGPDFVRSFLKRYSKEISEGINENDAMSTAPVAPQVLEDYFKELQISLEGVPLCNIVNYDESNLAHNPGKKKVLTKRGVNYPESTSKMSTSLMMAAAADGTLLPCYVVYKATDVDDSWTYNGPKNCRYNHTTSGWFDSHSFEDWVDTVALPYFDSKTGKKILLGDNLSSQLSTDVIRKCLKYNVHFVFLPPNSTYLTQPLDVALFKTLKIAWLDILLTWKETEGRTLPFIPHNVFPSLLKQMLEKIEPNIKQNILVGFNKTGINPLNKKKVLSRLPGNDIKTEISVEEKKAIDESVLSLLRGIRYGPRHQSIPKSPKIINIKRRKSVEDKDYDDSTKSPTGLSETLLITKKLKGIKTRLMNQLTSQEVNKNLKSKVLQPNLNIEILKLKGKGRGKQTKIQKLLNTLASDGIVDGNQNVSEQEDNLNVTDIATISYILDDDFLVTEEIEIINEPKKQEQCQISSQCSDDSLLSNGERMDFIVDEVNSLEDTEQRDNVQLSAEKLQHCKKTSARKLIKIMSVQKYTVRK